MLARSCARCSSTRRPPATGERKQLLRAILTDVVVTVNREAEQHVAQLPVVWEGGAITEHSVPLSRTGSQHALHRPGHDRARAPARRATQPSKAAGAPALGRCRAMSAG
jgi:hypothetical protein